MHLQPTHSRGSVTQNDWKHELIIMLKHICLSMIINYGSRMWKHVERGISPVAEWGNGDQGWLTPLWRNCWESSCVNTRSALCSLTWLRVESARSEEVGGEVDVDIAEEEQDILTPSPRPGTHFEAPTAWKLLIQLDQCEAPEPRLSGWTEGDRTALWDRYTDASECFVYIYNNSKRAHRHRQWNITVNSCP